MTSYENQMQEKNGLPANGDVSDAKSINSGVPTSYA